MRSKPPREFWVAQELDSNQAVVREHGEKWSDDVNGEPSTRWIRVVEHSAYAKLEAELVARSVATPTMNAVKILADKNAKLVAALRNLVEPPESSDMLELYQAARQALEGVKDE
jgi:hypothetical protein